MKVFRVVTERDGETTKQTGRTDTEIVQSDYRYAAETMGQVWAEINRKDFAFNDEIIMAIVEEHPMIKILEI